MITIKSVFSSSGHSRGSGFVVGKDGLLVTNYHVISSLIKEGKVDEKLNVYVRVSGREYLADIVKVDILNDLALLKLPIVFKKVARIRKTRLKKGESIYALGFHEKEFMAINQGTFNDYLSETENELMAISAPLNPGMSGGPIIDRDFSVVGVNVLKSGKESDGYGINALKLSEFLGKGIKDKQFKLSDILQRQLMETYKKIIDSINTTKSFHLLNNWKLLNFEHFMTCGETTNEANLNRDAGDLDQDQIVVDSKGCFIDVRKVPISAMGAKVEIAYLMANLKGSPNTRPQTYYSYLNNRFSFQKWDSVFAKVDEYRCKRSVLENKNGIRFKTSICLFKHESIPRFISDRDYYQYEIKAATLTKGLDDLVLHLRFSGSKKVAKQVIKTVINGISRVKAGEDVGRK